MRILRWSNQTLFSAMLAAAVWGYFIGSLRP